MMKQSFDLTQHIERRVIEERIKHIEHLQLKGDGSYDNYFSGTIDGLEWVLDRMPMNDNSN